MSKRMSRKQQALFEGAEEYTPIEEYDVTPPVAVVEAQPVQSETQPAATDCASEADASVPSDNQDTTPSAGCQEIGPENGQNDPEMAEKAPATPVLSLAEIQARIAAAAVEKARGVLRDLAEARREMAADEAKYAAVVAAAEYAAAQARDTLATAQQGAGQKAAAIREQAEKAADEAVTILGNGAQAILEQIIAAQEAELAAAQAQARTEIAAAQAELAAAQQAVEAAHSEADAARVLNQALTGDLEKELSTLTAASPAAAQAVEAEAQVVALVAEAEAFVDAQERSACDLERLIGQLAPYAADYPDAAYAIAGLQQYARAWYADQVREEIQAVEPGKGFEERLNGLVAQAEEAGVLELVEGEVEAARRRDRKALAEKGRAARLFARDLAQSPDVRPGDVIAHRAGRVTVFRSLDGNGKFRIEAVYTYAGSQWVEDGSGAVGRIVPQGKLGRRRIVVSGAVQ